MQIQVNRYTKINFELPKKLTTRQKWIIKHYSNPKEYDARDTVEFVTNYLNSFAGKRCSLSNFKDFLKPKYALREDSYNTRGPNYFLKQLTKRFDPTKPKSPKAIIPGNALGIEIECVIPHKWSKARIKDEIMARKIKNVEIKHDGSIRVENEGSCTSHDDSEDCENNSDDCCLDGEYGLEFTIITDIKDMSNLEALCKMLSEIGAYVNKSCGLHVHLDCRDVRNTADINHPTSATSRYNEFKEGTSLRANRLVWALPLLTKMLPKSRLDNTYCKYGKPLKNSSCRYYMVNTQALNEHCTIEVRMHSGTCDFNKISNFAKLIYSISRAEGMRFRALPKIIDNVSLLAALSMVDSKAKLDTDLKIYLLKRVQQFNPGLVNDMTPILNVELSEDTPIENHWDDLAESSAISSATQAQDCPF